MGKCNGYWQTCLHCGKLFYLPESRRVQNIVYCSRACKHADLSVSKVCPICGKSFEVPRCYQGRIRCCSRVCADRYRSKLLKGVKWGAHVYPRRPRTCEYCGKAYYGKPDRKYCSRDCADKAKHIMTTCLVCGSLFHADKKTRKYCSAKCRGQAKHLAQTVSLVCAGCGKEFRVDRCIYKVRPEKIFYCSIACYRSTRKPNNLEQTFWDILVATGHVFEFQYHAGHGYFIDFAMPKLRLAIETDGDYWHSRPDMISNDRRKNEYLLRRGWRVLRFTETEVNTRLSDCAVSVAQVVKIIKDNLYGLVNLVVGVFYYPGSLARLPQDQVE